MRLHNKKGFTLIEMMVVITIIAVMMTVFLLGRNKLSDQLNLKNQAYNLAYYIRQAQAYSLGVRKDSANKFDTSYGVAILMCPNSFGGKNIFYFTDQDKSGKTTVSGPPFAISEPGEVVNFLDNFKVKRIYIGASFARAGSDCNDNTKATRAFITFLRPSPTARFIFERGDGGAVSPAPPSNQPICFQIENETTGDKMGVKVDLTGQVSIQSTCP